MKNFLVFFKKEMYESVKTHRLLIMGAVFLLFGMMSPLLARFTPEIIKWAMASDPSLAGMDLSAMITVPTAFDSWAQFYGNTGMMGLIVLVVVFSGMISTELSRGTLTIMLSKGLSRKTVVAAKLTAAIFIWTICYMLSAITAWGYTVYIFDESVANLFLALFSIWLFGVLLLALTMLAATLWNNAFVCILAVGLVVVVMNLVGMIPAIGKYNPIMLASTSFLLLTTDLTPTGLYPAIAISTIAIFTCSFLALVFFNKNKKRGRKWLIVIAITAVVALAVTIFIGEEAIRKIRLNRYIISEKVTVGAGTEWELYGLLTLPRNAEGLVPGVVLVHGSGPGDMDSTIFDNKPFRDIAEHLSANGIAVIRYNKRTLTHGMKMTGEVAHGFTVWHETIEDALLAAAILKNDPRIDSDRIYIAGHSLGGMLAPRIHVMGGSADEDGLFAGLILLAGSPQFLPDISKMQNYAFIESMEEGIEKQEMLATMEAWDDTYAAYLSLSEEEAKNTLVPGWGGISAYYLLDLYTHPAAMYIEMITSPFLVMQPDDDIQVLTDVDFLMYQELLAGRSNVTFRLYPGLNHLFMPSTGRGMTELMDEYKIKAHVAPQVLDDIAAWINSGNHSLAVPSMNP
ncbi:MAG: alpha/beta fold hydrolase [Lachnospiraceae bacterium]|jgi:ABC-type transport system involved in multi-copper enzyme maturation permease subunit/dienelactone hydrolase|nr:alpha/beta fold hydrolase [Lachnospiraceae bacterium]